MPHPVKEMEAMSAVAIRSAVPFRYFIIVPLCRVSGRGRSPRRASRAEMGVEETTDSGLAQGEQLVGVEADRVPRTILPVRI